MTAYFVMLDSEIVRTYDNFDDARQKANHLAEGCNGELAVVSNGKVVYSPREMKL